MSTVTGPALPPAEGPVAPEHRAPPRRRRLVLGALALAAVAALALVLVTRLGRRQPAPPPARAVPVVEGDTIRFPAEFARRASIATAAVERREVAPVVLVPGTVELDPRRVATVGTRIPGRVRKVLKFEGEEVGAGEVLAEIESAELGRAQSELLKARAREAAAAADSLREERLAEAHISSLRDAQAARAAAVAAHAERLAAEQTVRSLGGRPDLAGEIGVLQLRSPMAGRVITSKLTRGKSLEATETPFLVADLGRVWLRLQVFERDVAAVHIGDGVDVARQADLSRISQGRVARTGEVIDPETHSAEVWVEVENGDGWLRPGEAVGARIRGRGDGRRWPAVPPEAIVTIDGRPTVFVATGPDTVRIRPVTLGITGEKYTAVASGVEEGERVVTSGAFALKSEIFR